MIGKVLSSLRFYSLEGRRGGRDFNQGCLSATTCEVTHSRFRAEVRQLYSLFLVRDYLTLFPNPAWSCCFLSSMHFQAPVQLSGSWRPFPSLFFMDSWSLDKLCSGLQQFHFTSLSIDFHQIKSVSESLPFLVSFLRF